MKLSGLPSLKIKHTVQKGDTIYSIIKTQVRNTQSAHLLARHVSVQMKKSLLLRPGDSVQFLNKGRGQLLVKVNERRKIILIPGLAAQSAVKSRIIAGSGRRYTSATNRQQAMKSKSGSYINSDINSAKLASQSKASSNDDLLSIKLNKRLLSRIKENQLRFLRDSSPGEKAKFFVMSYHPAHPERAKHLSTSIISLVNSLLADHRKSGDVEIAYWQTGARPQNQKLIYLGFKEGGRRIGIYRFQLPDGTCYFLYENGSKINAQNAAAPLSNLSVSSGYGFRKHPLDGYRKMHTGVDYRARIGTPVFSVLPGRVDEVGRKRGYGLYVKIQHSPEDATLYAHLHSAKVVKGQRVNKGYVIGAVGISGSTSGAHLHFEYRRKERPTDPSKILRTAHTMLSPVQMRQFSIQKELIEANLRSKSVTHYIY